MIFFIEIHCIKILVDQNQESARGVGIAIGRQSLNQCEGRSCSTQQMVVIKSAVMWSQWLQNQILSTNWNGQYIASSVSQICYHRHQE
jgi:hypothetical protein